MILSFQPNNQFIIVKKYYMVNIEFIIENNNENNNDKAIIYYTYKNLDFDFNINSECNSENTLFQSNYY